MTHKKSDVILNLDCATLAVLFPEGSEARVNLQAAVVNNFVDRISKEKMGEMFSDQVALINSIITSKTAAVRAEMDAKVEEAISAYFNKTGYYNPTRTLTDASRQKIRDSLESDFTDTINKKIAEMGEDVRLRTAIDNALHAKISSTAGSSFTSAVKSIVKETLRGL